MFHPQRDISAFGVPSTPQLIGLLHNKTVVSNQLLKNIDFHSVVLEAPPQNYDSPKLAVDAACWT